MIWIKFPSAWTDRRAARAAQRKPRGGPSAAAIKSRPATGARSGQAEACRDGGVQARPFMVPERIPRGRGEVRAADPDGGAAGPPARGSRRPCRKRDATMSGAAPRSIQQRRDNRLRRRRPAGRLIPINAPACVPVHTRPRSTGDDAMSRHDAGLDTPVRNAVGTVMTGRAIHAASEALGSAIAHGGPEMASLKARRCGP